MLNRKTVFVIGAGAGADFGLPLGNSLRDIIARYLGLYKLGDFGPNGPEALVYAVQRLAKEAGTNNVNPYLHAAREIAANIPYATSIDEFIDHNNGRPHIEIMGKMAIVGTILDAESKSHILQRHQNTVSINHGSLAKYDAWIIPFWQLIQRGSHRSRPQEIFQNVAFIIFNYDRSIELFLIQAMQSFFGMSEQEAVDLVARLDIVHPYGSIAPLSGKGALGYGQSPDRMSLEIIAQNIRTYCESKDSAVMERALGFMSVAEHVVFIGFAFHDQNMEFLDTGSSSLRRSVFGTTFAVSEENKAHITDEIISRIECEYEDVRLYDIKGGELLRRLDRKLRS